MRAWFSRLLLLAAASFVCGLAPRAFADPVPPDAVLRPGLDRALRSLIATTGWQTELEGGYRFDRLEVAADHARFDLVARDGSPAGSLLLVHPTATTPPAARSSSFAIIARPTAPDPTVERLLARASADIIAHDRGDFWAVVAPPRAPPTDADTPDRPIWPFALLAAIIALALTLRLSRFRIEPEVKFTHVLPALIQVVIYAYWSLYWRPLLDQFPVIGLQILFAYALDLTLSWARTRRWHLTFGPLPIVLSTNLFIQFHPSEAAVHALPIAIAIASRHIFRRDGRPLFNPSALGIAVLGALNLLWPALGDPDIALEFAIAPNMAELLLAAALIVQVRIPVVLISAGVALGIFAHNQFADFSTFMPSWPPVLLVLVLLATDPATMPRTNPGRLLSGLAFGLAMAITGHALTVSGQNDFYGKVLPLPFINALAPQFDRLGAALTRRLPRATDLLDPRCNRLHIAVWLAAMSLSIVLHKQNWFDAPLQSANRTPCLITRSDTPTACDLNPLFCEGFRVDLELQCWLAGAPRPPG